LPPLESARITFVYLGQLAAHKGIELLIEAAAALRPRDDFSVLIAGDENRYADQLRARVRDHGLEGTVVFLGRVDDIERLFVSVRSRAPVRGARDGVHHRLGGHQGSAG
jgi:glycosyltransferase involved in cell wall biosynthesis